MSFPTPNGRKCRRKVKPVVGPCRLELGWGIWGSCVQVFWGWGGAALGPTCAPFFSPSCSEAADPQPAEDGPNSTHDDNGVHEPPLDHGEQWDVLGWGLGYGMGMGHPLLMLLCSPLAAIHAGAPDPTAHQPCAEGGEGSMGGCEGKTLLN